MNRLYRRCVLSLIVAAVTLASFSTRALSEEVLRYKFTAGEKLNYKMTQKMKMTITPENVPKAMETTTDQTTEMVWSIKEVKDDQTAVIDQTMKHIKMDVSAPGGGGFQFDSSSEEEPQGPVAAMVAPLLKTLAAATFQVEVSSRGEILQVNVPEEVTAAMAKTPTAAQMGEMFTKEGFEKMMQQGAIVFPEGGIQEGAEWSRNLEIKNPATGGKQSVETKYRYEGREEVDGKSLDKFGVEIVLDFGDGAGPGGSQITIESQGSKGTIYFDRDAGRMHSASIDMVMDMSLAVEDKIIKMHLDQVVKTDVTPASE